MGHVGDLPDLQSLSRMVRDAFVEELEGGLREAAWKLSTGLAQSTADSDLDDIIAAETRFQAGYRSDRVSHVVFAPPSPKTHQARKRWFCSLVQAIFSAQALPHGFSVNQARGSHACARCRGRGSNTDKDAIEWQTQAFTPMLLSYLAGGQQQ